MMNIRKKQNSIAKNNVVLMSLLTLLGLTISFDSCRSKAEVAAPVVVVETEADYENYYNSIHLDLFLIDKTYDDFKGKFQRFELALLYGLMNARRHKSMFFDYTKKCSL